MAGPILYPPPKSLVSITLLTRKKNNLLEEQITTVSDCKLNSFINLPVGKTRWSGIHPWSHNYFPDKPVILHCCAVLCLKTDGFFPPRVSNVFLLFQWWFPVQSGSEHVPAAAAGGRTHGLPEPGPVLSFDALDVRFPIMPISAQR